jgi:predicted RNase H-like HicB family nuclease
MKHKHFVKEQAVAYRTRVHPYNFSVVIEKDKDGYFAYCPVLQGCYSQGDTYEETLTNIKDAIKLHVEDRIKDNEEIPERELVSVTNVSVNI